MIDEIKSDSSSTIPAHDLAMFKANQRSLLDRMRKNFYYGRRRRLDTLTMPLTEVTVDMIERYCCWRDRGLEVFDLQFAASVSKKAQLSPCSVMMAIIYLERLNTKNPEYVRSASPCELFLVSMMVASKFLFDEGEDEQVYNDEWASSGGIDLKTINRLEREFLAAIGWRLYVDPLTFYSKLAKLETLITTHVVSKRNWKQLTYNEMINLLNSPPNKNLIYDSIIQFVESIIKLAAISCLVYASTFIALNLLGLSARRPASMSSLAESNRTTNHSLASVVSEGPETPIDDDPSITQEGCLPIVVNLVVDYGMKPKMNPQIQECNPDSHVITPNIGDSHHSSALNRIVHRHKKRNSHIHNRYRHSLHHQHASQRISMAGL